MGMWSLGALFPLPLAARSLARCAGHRRVTAALRARRGCPNRVGPAGSTRGSARASPRRACRSLFACAHATSIEARSSSTTTGTFVHVQMPWIIQ